MIVYQNPSPTVDIIIELVDQPHRPIILIERKHEPFGWAIPGGFMDYGESVENAAMREALEEVSLNVKLIEQFQVYSDPARDSRKHTMSIVFIASAIGQPKPADDALNLGIFNIWEIPNNLCFDHDLILQDYLHYRNYHIRPPIRYC
ncbi:NUDIX hydrolase [Geminocystis sp. NIES-3709]|uniref:NUDIX domain-containing protein n=1 Tax=Geminocystis sp. NIES-3709 TaxID=1617448 RepID=UPI0005FC9577|nr:NUDIX hydrolase [Geminocystis sp. NIES-3709]BAQ66854.1 ADP-ribose pyrophosphatase [Geminocystis sp. NIES-3709]